MPDIGPDLGPDIGPDLAAFPATAPVLLPGGPILLTLTGVPGPVDLGSVVVTVTQGAASVTLRGADGTAAIPQGGGLYTLTAPLPYPLPAGLTAGVTETLAWADTVGGQPQAYAQQGVLLPVGLATADLPPEADNDFFALYPLTQGVTKFALAFPVPADQAYGIVSATLVLRPLLSSAPLLPDKPAALQGAALDTSRLGETPAALRLLFPDGWAELALPAGDWAAYARALYDDGSVECFDFPGVLSVRSNGLPGSVPA